MVEGGRISRAVFAHAVALLTERYARPVSPGLARVYLERFLADDLTSEELAAGVKQALAECEFFPTAKQISDFARPVLDAKIAGGGVFVAIVNDDLVRLHDGAREVWSVAAVRDRHGEAAARAFLAIGGASRFRTMNDADAVFARRDFAAAYAAIVAETAARHHTSRALGAGAEARRIVGPEKRTGLERLGAITPRALPSGAAVSPVPEAHTEAPRNV